MKKIFLVLGLAAAVVGCGQDGGGSEDARARTRPGALSNGPVSKDKPGVEFTGQYPGGTNAPNSGTNNQAQQKAF